MSKFEMDVSLWPLVRSNVGDALEDADYDVMFREWESVMARRQRFVSLTDARASKTMPSSKQRARIADWSRTIDAPSRLYSLGHAMVVTSALTRGAMTAISWLHKPSSPQVYVATLVEASAWCIEAITKDGLAISPAITSYHTELVKRRA